MTGANSEARFLSPATAALGDVRQQPASGSMASRYSTVRSAAPISVPGT